jgi:hypothetical protein
VSQPKESFEVKLTSSLPGQAQSVTNGSEGLGWAAVQAIAGDDDVVQGAGKASHQTVESLVDESDFYLFLGVWSLLLRRVRDEKLLGVGLGLGHGPPNGSLDGWDGVSGESSATCGIVAPQSLPQGDATHVQGLSIGEISQPLAAHHPVH